MKTKITNDEAAHIIKMLLLDDQLYCAGIPKVEKELKEQFQFTDAQMAKITFKLSRLIKRITKKSYVKQEQPVVEEKQDDNKGKLHWKNEDASNGPSGPVYIEGKLADQWYTRNQAIKMAKKLKLHFEEV